MWALKQGAEVSGTLREMRKKPHQNADLPQGWRDAWLGVRGAASVRLQKCRVQPLSQSLRGWSARGR